MYAFFQCNVKKTSPTVIVWVPVYANTIS